jgi:hypothetical protein
MNSVLLSVCIRICMHADFVSVCRAAQEDAYHAAHSDLVAAGPATPSLIEKLD